MKMPMNTFHRHFYEWKYCQIIHSHFTSENIAKFFFSILLILALLLSDQSLQAEYDKLETLLEEEKEQRKDIEKAMKQVAEELGDLKANNLQLKDDKEYTITQVDCLQRDIKVNVDKRMIKDYVHVTIERLSLG